MSNKQVRTYVGLDPVGNVMEEVDGVLYIANCRADLAHRSEASVEDGTLLLDPQLSEPFVDGPPRYEFIDVDSNLRVPVREDSFAVERLADEDDVETTMVDDASKTSEPVASDVDLNGVLGSEEEVIVMDVEGGEGMYSFRVGKDSTIVVDDLSGGAAMEPVPVPTPEVGMLFELGEEFIAFCHRYAHLKGFGARIFGSDKDPKCPRTDKPSTMQVINNVLVSAYVDCFRIRVCCRKEGKYTSKSSDPDRSGLTCRTDCRCLITARRNPRRGNPWRISSVELHHNHPFDEAYSRYLPRYRTISPADQMQILQLQKAGVKASLIYDFFVNDRCGFKNVPFCEVDLKNFLYLHNAAPRKDGDFVAMEHHFRKMREQCPGFVYDFEKDKDGRLKNVFWADSRCIQAFLDFGDIVSFDTTFVSNRYRMPFAVFVGCNDSGQTILFGCALLATENTESFVWLFETWKRCMGGKAPLRILTDQDTKIGNAIRVVFPDKCHRWCLWHVMQNCRRHLGKRKDWGEIYSGLQYVLHDSLCVGEFENRWNDWADKFDVWGVEWVKTMYAKRSSWCPVYFKSDFWAGMSSTQRSEGMHHYFKGYVNVNTGLTEFVERYGRAICKRITEEERERKKGMDRHATDTSRHAFEPVFELLYTRAKYLELHGELIAMGGNVAIKVSENDTEVAYDVESKSFRPGWARKTIHRVVVTKATSHVSCECKNFEFRGILCAHALRVF